MKKDFIALIFAVLLIVFAVNGTKIQSVDDYYLTHIDDITTESETIAISIECSTIIDNWKDLDPALRFEKYVPSNGIILPLSVYVLRSGDSVFDVLLRAVRHNKIQMEYQGADMNHFGSVYIQGINHLYEFSCGPHSGWLFRVNGLYPNYGCSNYRLKDGDVIEWKYTCNLGFDVGNSFEG